jgi:hypothetical protein
MDRKILVEKELEQFIKTVENLGMTYKGLRLAFPEFESSSFALLVITPNFKGMSRLSIISKMVELLHANTEVTTRQQIHTIKTFDTEQDYLRDMAEYNYMTGNMLAFA